MHICCCSTAGDCVNQQAQQQLPRSPGGLTEKHRCSRNVRHKAGPFALMQCKAHLQRLHRFGLAM
jgi:hypothetical protein